jgi:hypothetical protein
MRRLPSSDFDKLLKVLPKTLRMLVIPAYLEDEMLARLPENITSFSAFASEGITEGVFQYLPPSLSTITLPRSFTVKQEHDWFLKVPRSVKLLHCGSFGTQYTEHRKAMLQKLINPGKY